MKPWLPPTDRADCVARFGNMAQFCGLKRYAFSDGKARGVEAVDADTGAGFTYTVLPGRGMDVAWTKYKGVPISYISKAGIVSPAYHDPRENQWLKNFFAGAVTTCGLTNAGPPCRGEMGFVGEVPFGLHGDISNTGADNVCVREGWEGGIYRMAVSGRVQEGRLHGEHLALTREITSQLGEKRFFLRDTFENLGEIPQPLMFFYHINIGHPVLAEGSRFLAPSKSVACVTDVARAGLSEYDLCHAPTPGYIERQYFHDMAAHGNGQTVAALVNDELELGVYIRYNAREMPRISQWKVLRDAEYVLAFEPGNCYPIGRDAAQEEGTLETLAPMASRTAGFELGILDGAAEIAAVRAEIESLVKREE